MPPQLEGLNNFYHTVKKKHTSGSAVVLEALRCSAQGWGGEDQVSIRPGHMLQDVARLVTVRMFYSRSAAC